MTEEAPILPRYQRPGIPTAHPKQSAPLFKMAKMMVKMKLPKLKTKTTNQRALKKRKKARVQ